ncbi:porin [Aurantimonas coralicida]|uniref:porin n=1 Tax=Aurantimonas coralicida TaxID=182270 RepID=UPI001D187003|nr:porin [Aurantimonas coralicida]MCC4296489.1 porin [Aurantimonas coralicida]MCD1643099.1 porin [Aurantimonas coralicida]|tara:strand:- start:716 stop:1939 length:1224 start_codon:yes stop_codon:yes gene_type:complete
MNIKSLLLGSAAALVAVSGARAADVIMPVAPEPVDYVRVCDVYGTGFYYIPGTETCLSINGYVRFQYNVAGGIEDDFGNDLLSNLEGDNYQAGSAVRVRLNFDAREETELGTLRAFARVQAQNSGGAYSNDASYNMDMGFIQLGGLTMGYLDSLWTEGDGLLTDTDLAVGDYQLNRVSYTYAANGFTAALSLEDDTTGDFAPDVVGRLAYAGGWGSIYLAGSYDEEVRFGQLTQARFAPAAFGIDPQADDGAFALKAGLSLTDLIAADSELKIEGSYAFDPSSYSTIGIFSTRSTLGRQIDSLTATLPVEWQIGAGYAQQFGKLGVAVSGAYGETFETYNFATATTFSNIGDGEYYKLVGNVGYEITNNFDMLAEISYANIDFDGQNGFVDNSLDQTAGFLRFVRSF